MSIEIQCIALSVTLRASAGWSISAQSHIVPSQSHRWEVFSHGGKLLVSSGKKSSWVFALARLSRHTCCTPWTPGTARGWSNTSSGEERLCPPWWSFAPALFPSGLAADDSSAHRVPQGGPQWWSQTSQCWRSLWWECRRCAGASHTWPIWHLPSGTAVLASSPQASGSPSWPQGNVEELKVTASGVSDITQGSAFVGIEASCSSWKELWWRNTAGEPSGGGTGRSWWKQAQGCPFC